MSDYYTKFSLVLPLPDVAAQTYAVELHRLADSYSSEEPIPSDLPEDLKDYLEDWSFELETQLVEGRPGLWLYSDFGGIDAVCAFLQHLLQKFDPDGKVAFEWSFDCSKHRVDAFGGGAALITATEIRSMTTQQWLQQQSDQTLHPSTQG